jgi:phage gp36-like protein
MSDFLISTPAEQSDYKPAVHAEILDAIIRTDQPTLEMAEDRAVAEMQSYLSSRYDVVNIFNKSGTARNQLIVMFAVDITLYHLYSAINRMRTPVERVERYKRAIEWLKDVADGLINPVGLPLVTDPETGEDTLNPIRWGSETKYGNGW